jgi:all-trans-8'-apo-beta-carotenal 15,15'-oxygenase
MTVTSTEPGQQTPLRGWHRIFEPLHEEHDYLIDEVEGRIPEELVGTMYRNGPGKWEQGGSPLAHLLEGDGMISAFRIENSQVRYRNRYVRTPAYGRGLGVGGMVDRTAGTLLPGGPEANVGKEVVKQANTHVIRQADRLLALYGGSAPWVLDPDTLETRELWDLDGVLGPTGFSAHAKVDQRDGALYNFGTVPGPEPTIHLYRIDRSGRPEALGSHIVPYAHWVHDFALSQRYFVFALSPFQFDLQKMAAGEMSPTRALRVMPELGAHFVLVPRAGGQARIIEHEAFAYFHVTNAFDDGDDVVVDLAEFAQPFEAVNQVMFDYRTGGTEYFANRVIRFRISPSGKVSSEPLTDLLSDWPQLDWRRVGLKHRYSYHATTVADTAAGGLEKIDGETGRSTHHALPAGHVVGEPSFVPRSRDADEDDGWVLFTAYDPHQHRSRLLILDAQAVDAEPVAVAWMRHHLPLTFHGSFASV